ncbi:MAG: hypothetical protein PVJ27_01240 [Candidatus Brocadiaceae bacterium]|jgi:hypothetical protein
MRRRGCVLAAIGAALLLGSLSVGSLWLMYPHARTAHDSFRFSPKRALQDVPAVLHGGDRYRARVVLTIPLDAREEPQGEAAEPDETLLRFPLRYRVAGQGGKPLAWQDTFVRWKLPTDGLPEPPATEGSRLIIAEELSSFRAPEGGKVTVSAEVGRDTMRGAQVAEGELSLHGPSLWARLMPLAIGAFCLGPTILFIGVVVFLCSLSAGERR